MILTQEELKKFLKYDPDTGIFTRIIKTSNSIRVGDLAGCTVVKRNKKSYIIISVVSKHFYAHRLACLYMTGCLPEHEVDHINGNGKDNRWCNLRNVCRQENMRNLRRQHNNTSGITGVYWNKKNSNWAAQIKINNKQKSLGSFNNIFDAACSRRNAEIKYGFHENHGSDRPL